MSGGKIEDETGKTFLNDIQPLLQALDVLTNFASSAQFASIPAKISDQVCSMSQCSSVLWLKRRCIKLKNSINTGTFAENSILQLISLWMCFCENLCFCRLCYRKFKMFLFTSSALLCSETNGRIQQWHTSVFRAFRISNIWASWQNAGLLWA